LAPTVFAYLMLAHPTGHLERLVERRVVATAGAILMISWTYFVLTKAQPPFKTPLLQCAPQCPRDAFVFGPASSGLDPVVKAAVYASWLTVALAPPIFIWSRLRSATPAVGRAMLPVGAAALVNVLLLVAYSVTRTAGSPAMAAVGAAYVAGAAVIPLAILLGLALARQFVATALAAFTTDLVQDPRADPATMMARALSDPSLRIAYERREAGPQVDFFGNEVDLGNDGDQAVAWIKRNGRRIAAVSYDASLVAQAPFVQAAGAAAMMRLEAAGLEADLRASTRALAASRTRLVEAADAERRRIERDIHDGVQQQLVGLRIKVDLAAEATEADPTRAREMMATLGRQMDDVIESLRSLARGIYPSLLTDHGLVDALRSVARRALVPVAVRSRGVGRYAEDVEVAVYFCCLEAIQNVIKHAGADAEAVVRLWEDGDDLHFEISDNGTGFDLGAAKFGSGLVNMIDRIEAVDGALTVNACPGHGTTILGYVPLAPF
jgi:signal transduction histidine kinase